MAFGGDHHTYQAPRRAFVALFLSGFLELQTLDWCPPMEIGPARPPSGLKQTLWGCTRGERIYSPPPINPVMPRTRRRPLINRLGLRLLALSRMRVQRLKADAKWKRAAAAEARLAEELASDSTVFLAPRRRLELQKIWKAKRETTRKAANRAQKKSARVEQLHSTGWMGRSIGRMISDPHPVRQIASDAVAAWGEKRLRRLRKRASAKAQRAGDLTNASVKLDEKTGHHLSPRKARLLHSARQKSANARARAQRAEERVEAAERSLQNGRLQKTITWLAGKKT